MLFVFRRSIYAHNTRTSRILSHRNNWYGDFGSLLSSNLFYYEKKDAVIKANCLFPVCRLCFSYQYCDLLMKQINDTLVVGTIIVPRQERFVLEKDKRKRKKCQGKD